uniref:carbohydrate ABC transporter permease n=1 Tax=Roseburia sp. TaxID=2049040 RepID=UPI003FEE42A3
MKKIKRSKRLDKNTRRVSGFFLTPSILGVLTFFVVPFFVVIYYSFVDNPINGEFVGFQNYVNVIQNQAFRTAVGNTLLFSLIAVPLVMVLSMLMAFMMDTAVPFKSQFRSFFLSPLMVPVASVVLIWQVVFDYNGMLNHITSYFGAEPVDWLKSSWGMAVVILLFLWKNLGYDMILFMSAIANIPQDIIEVAELDGASTMQVFWHVKIRYMSPAILFVMILSIINSFRVFREVYLLTGGYPDQSLYMLQHYMNNTFASADYQKLSTAAIYMSLVMIVIIGLLFWVENRFGKDVEEE